MTKWSNTSQADRKRKKVQVSLSDEARTRLRELAEAHPERTQSAVVEGLVLRAKR